MDEKNMTNIHLLTGNDVSRTLKISRAYAYQLMCQSDIPTIRIGRSVKGRYEDLMEFIDNNRSTNQDVTDSLVDNKK